MRKADFKARIKKIEIVDRVLSDSWEQSIRVILEDIDLTNENLLELKQFMPNENVFVEITPVQASLFDPQVPKKSQENGPENCDELNSDDEMYFNNGKHLLSRYARNKKASGQEFGPLADKKKSLSCERLEAHITLHDLHYITLHFPIALQIALH